MDGIRSGYAAKTADPSASLGMTRGERLLLGRLATWADGVRNGTPRGLQIPPLRFAA
jgi:hypothetical protein